MNKYSTRENFGKLFMEVYQTGRGAELGVQQGFNAARILKHWKGLLICVDNWIRHNELAECVERLNYLSAAYIRKDTVEAAAEIEGRSLDFVYIDADHSYEGLKRDFEAWFPKVRRGGIVSGHDYGANNDCPGVKQFVDEYQSLHPEIEIHYTTEDFYHGENKAIDGNEYQSWWFIKP